MAALFEAPSVELLAAWLERRRPEGTLAGIGPAADPMALAATAPVADAVALVPTAAAADGAPALEAFPLSSAQQRLWFLERLNPGQAGYHFGVTLRLSRRLEVSALAARLGRDRAAARAAADGVPRGGRCAAPEGPAGGERRGSGAGGPARYGAGAAGGSSADGGPQAWRAAVRPRAWTGRAFPARGGGRGRARPARGLPSQRRRRLVDGGLLRRAWQGSTRRP